MLLGLGVTANEQVGAILKKTAIAEASRLDYVWIADAPTQFNAPAVASAIASTTRRIRIGVGLVSILLHSSSQIASSVTALSEAHGNRFDICIGVGDRFQLTYTGIHVEAIRDLPQRMLATKQEISSQLHDSGVKANIWLGAQGPRMLQLANAFHGVLMNYSKPEMIAWAIKQMRLHGSQVALGIYAPSYVYVTPRPSVLRLTKISSATVALGATNGVLKQFGLHNRFHKARMMVETGRTVKSIIANVPDDVTNFFSITIPAMKLPSYLTELKRLGVKTVIFGYPQNHSLGSVKDLVEALHPQHEKHKA